MLLYSILIYLILYTDIMLVRVTKKNNVLPVRQKEKENRCVKIIFIASIMDQGIMYLEMREFVV